MKVKFEVFILIPDKRLITLTKEVARKYKVYKALKDQKGPHISFLYPQEKLEDKEVKEIIKYYSKKLEFVKPFYLQINGISYFRKTRKSDNKINYAVYVGVEPSKELTRLYRIFNKGIEDYNYWRYRTFKPHISLARTDLDKEKFYKIIKNYKDYKIKFKIRLTCIYAGTRSNKKQKWKLVKMKLGSK